METTWRIYSYEDAENKVAYVGLTKQAIKRRHNGHIHRKRADTIRDYFISINKTLPMPIEKMEIDTEEDAQYYEDWYVKGYKRAGWRVLNIAKTGEGSSSVGSDGGHAAKWNYDTCFEIAKKFKTKSEFHSEYSQAWLIAQKNGWIKDYTWFEHPRKDMGYWDYEHCKEEAMKYKTKVEFRNNCNSAYNVSLRNGWINEYDWFENGRVKWTYDKCYEEALKYSIQKEFNRKCKGAYFAAYKNNWLKDYYWFLSAHEARVIGNKKQWEDRTTHISQYTLNGEFIKEWESVSEAAKSLGKPTANFCACCKGKRKYAYGYIWKYAA